MLTAVFGMVAPITHFVYATAWVLGIFLFGAMVGLYVVSPSLYPASARTTGMGWALGVGRLGAIAAPACAGVLIDAGWDPSRLYYVFSIPLFAAVLSAVCLWRVSQSSSATA